MKHSKNEIDELLSKSKYNDVLKQTAYLHNSRPPSLYLSDRKKLYLSSSDMVIDTNNFRELIDTLKNLASNYKLKSQRSLTAKDEFNLAIIRCDFNEVCLVLKNLEVMNGILENTENYNFDLPDDLFKELTSKD